MKLLNQLKLVHKYDRRKIDFKGMGLTNKHLRFGFMVFIPKIVVQLKEYIFCFSTPQLFSLQSKAKASGNEPCNFFLH